MNPFKDIDPKKGLQQNDKSPFYDRFCLSFDQIMPFCIDPIYGRVYTRIKEGRNNDVLLIYEMFPEHIQRLINLFQRKEFVNTCWDIDCIEKEEYSFVLEEQHFLVIEMTGDFIYFSMENLYFALLELSEFIEDCHFFVYATGDREAYWLDEYLIRDEELTFSRHELEIEADYGRLHFYIKRALQHPGDESLKHFTLYQVEDNRIFSNFIKRVRKHPDELKSEAPELFQLYQDYKKLVR